MRKKNRDEHLAEIAPFQ